MDDNLNVRAPAAPYTPDESYVQSLFARPDGQAIAERETFIAGHAFNGVDGEEADRLRWVNLHRRPMRVKEEKG